MEVIDDCTLFFVDILPRTSNRQEWFSPPKTQVLLKFYSILELSMKTTHPCTQTQTQGREELYSTQLIVIRGPPDTYLQTLKCLCFHFQADFV